MWTGIICFAFGFVACLLMLIFERVLEDGRTARAMEKNFRASAIRHANEQREQGVA